MCTGIGITMIATRKGLRPSYILCSNLIYNRTNSHFTPIMNTNLFKLHISTNNEHELFKLHIYTTNEYELIQAAQVQTKIKSPCWC